MRTIIAIATVATVMLGSTATAGKTQREETDDYLGAGIAGVVGINSQSLIDLGSAHFRGGSERFVSVTIADETGSSILGEVAQNLDSDAAPEISHFFCGETTKPLRVKPRVDVVVYLYSGRCENGDLSIPISGTVTATFTKQK